MDLIQNSSYHIEPDFIVNNEFKAILIDGMVIMYDDISKKRNIMILSRNQAVKKIPISNKYHHYFNKLFYIVKDDIREFYLLDIGNFKLIKIEGI